jgi:Spy/CpxP family protein refolding chaperone
MEEKIDEKIDEEQIKRIITKIELTKHFRNKFDNLMDEATKEQIYLFSDAKRTVHREYDIDISELRLRLCQLRGE